MRRGLLARLGVALFIPISLLAVATRPAAAAVVPIEGLSLDPSWMPVNTPPGSATVVIRGIGFTPSTTVTVDGVPATTTVIDSRTLQIQAPTSASAKAVSVVVANGSDSDEIFPFIYTNGVCYVQPAGSDSASCLTPGTAMKTIAAALTEVQRTGFPGTMVEIRVAAGTYNEVELGVVSGVVLTGGWNAAFTQRNPDAFVTVIDAGRASFAMRSAGLDARQIIDGVTVKNGVREGLGGGGFVISGDNTVISNSVFVGNTSSARGGAIYATFSTTYGGRSVLSKNVVLGNRSFSANAGGGISIYPIYTQGQRIDVSISDNYIVGNRSFQNRGGGFGLSSSMNYAYNVLKLAAVGNVVVGNRAISGGGAAVLALGGSDRFELLFDNNLFSGNVASGEGGGLVITGTGQISGMFSDNTIEGNLAAADGGGGIKFSPSVNYAPTFEVTHLISWGNTNGDFAGVPLATFSDVGGGVAGTGNISADPMFRSGPMGRLYLAQDANGVSPAVDAGGGTAFDYAQEGQTTNPQLVPDSGIVDMGYHYPLSAGLSADPIAISRIDPPDGDMGGADWILIRGQGFDPGAGVSLGGVPATDVLYVSSARVLARPAAHAPGVVDVTVTNPDATAATIPGGYRYGDNLPPEWVTTVGLQQVETKKDCVRSATLRWNPAADGFAQPVRYSVYREICTPSVNDFKNPCVNTGYFAGASNFVTTTTESFYVDTDFGSGGADPKFIYLVRAADSAAPLPNNEFNYSKRIALIGKQTGDLTPPSQVGDTLGLAPNGALDWAGAPGAVSYRVYRQTAASAYMTPGSLTPLATLTIANNDLDANGVTDSAYADAAVPAPEQIFFYKITALDPCGNETQSELGP